MRLFVLVILVSSICSAQQGTPGTVIQPEQNNNAGALETAVRACRQDPNLEICQNLNKTIDRVSNLVTDLLEDEGVKSTAGITAGIAKVAIDQRVQITTGDVKIIRADESTIEVNHERVFIRIRWDLD